MRKKEPEKSQTSHLRTHRPNFHEVSNFHETRGHQEGTLSPAPVPTESASNLAFRNSETLSGTNEAQILDSPHLQRTKDGIREAVDQIKSLGRSPIPPENYWPLLLPQIGSAMGATSVAIWAYRTEPSRWTLVDHWKLPSSLFTLPYSRKETSSHHDLESGFENFSSDKTDKTLGPSSIGPPPQSYSDVIDKPIEKIESYLDSMIENEPEPYNQSDSSSSAGEPDQSQIKAHAHQVIDDWEEDSQLDAILPSDALQRILDEVRRENQPVLIPPGEASLNGNRPLNPTSSLMMLVPVPMAMEGGKVWLQILQPPSGGLSSQRGYLRFATQMSDLIAEYLKTYRLRILERDQQFFHLAHHVLHDSCASNSIEGSLAKLLRTIRDHCSAEHAFLFVQHRGWLGSTRWQLQSISGMERIDRRADGIQQLESAAFDLIRLSGKENEFQFGSTLSETRMSLPRSVERIESNLSIGVGSWFFPLTAEGPSEITSPELIDIITRSSNTHQSRLAPVTKDVALLLTWDAKTARPANALEQASLLLRLGLSTLRPRWANSLAPQSVLYQKRKASTRKLITALVVILSLVGIGSIPVPIQIESTASIYPVETDEFFSPSDSVVEKVLVVQGQKVRKGEVLIQLDSASLESELDQAKAAYVESSRRLEELDHELLRNRNLSASERDALESQRDSLSEMVGLGLKTIESLQRRIEQLILCAKQDGTVETWRVDETLQGRPVRHGQWLLSVRSDETKWEFEATIPESALADLQRIANIEMNRDTDTESAQIRLVAYPNKSVPVQWTAPARWYPEVSTSQDTLSKKDSNYVVPFRVDVSMLPTEPIAGANARIFITTGRGPLAWALSKDFIENLVVRGAMWLR